eukprot:gene9585-biopygen3727
MHLHAYVTQLHVCGAELLRQGRGYGGARARMPTNSPPLPSPPRQFHHPKTDAALAAPAVWRVAVDYPKPIK